MKSSTLLLLLMFVCVDAPASEARARLLDTSCASIAPIEANYGSKLLGRAEASLKLGSLFFSGTHGGRTATISYKCNVPGLTVRYIQVVLSIPDRTEATTFLDAEVAGAEALGYKRCVDTAALPKRPDFLDEVGALRVVTLRLGRVSDYTIKLSTFDNATATYELIVLIGPISRGLVPGSPPAKCQP